VLVACYKERDLASEGCGDRSDELRRWCNLLLVEGACSHLVLTEFYRVSEFLDEALGFAAQASEAASEEVEKRFDEAVLELGKYDEMFDPG
jgi:hypothetical protein